MTHIRLSHFHHSPIHSPLQYSAIRALESLNDVLVFISPNLSFSLWVSYRDIWMELINMGYRRSHVNHRTWFFPDLKLSRYVKAGVVELSVGLTGLGPLLFPCLKSRQLPSSECSDLRISPWKKWSPGTWEVPVWTLPQEMKCFYCRGYWRNSRTTQV